jgi:hypothetical protein
MFTFDRSGTGPIISATWRCCCSTWTPLPVHQAKTSLQKGAESLDQYLYARERCAGQDDSPDALSPGSIPSRSGRMAARRNSCIRWTVPERFVGGATLGNRVGASGDWVKEGRRPTAVAASRAQWAGRSTSYAIDYAGGGSQRSVR